MSNGLQKMQELLRAIRARRREKDEMARHRRRDEPRHDDPPPERMSEKQWEDMQENQAADNRAKEHEEALLEEEIERLPEAKKIEYGLKELPREVDMAGKYEDQPLKTEGHAHHAHAAEPAPGKTPALTDEQKKAAAKQTELDKLHAEESGLLNQLADVGAKIRMLELAK